MSWGEVELESEVADWFLALDEDDQARVGFHVDRLGELGPLLDEPHTKQLERKLRELRFSLSGRPTRMLLTVFAKTRPNERREVDRAKRALQRCMTEHGLTGDQDE